MKCRLGVCASRNCERLFKNFALTKDCAGGTAETKSANDYSCRYGRGSVVGRGLGAGVPLGVGVGCGIDVGADVAVAGFFDSPRAAAQRRFPSSECYHRLIRTGLGSCVAHLICEGGMAFLTCVICIAAGVRHVDDEQ